MISQTAEYALRAVVYLADQEGRARGARTVTQIAEATQVPAGYLAKVMQNLSRAGLVRSQRGLHGGFVLAQEADKLTVLEVINVVDPIRRFPTCPLDIPDHGERLCPLHRRLDDAAQTVEEAFCQTSIADLLAVPRGRKPPCRFPVTAETAAK